MNAIETVLSDDLANLIDRLATSIPEGAMEEIRTTAPTLSARMDAAESNLSAIRARLVEDYGRWTRALDDLENLWALAAWRVTAEDSPQPAVPLAA